MNERGKGKTLLKKAFSPSPAPPSSFPKLLVISNRRPILPPQGTRVKPSSTVLPFFVPERRTRYRRAQKPSQSSAWKFAVERAPDVAGPRSVENQPSGLLLQPGPRCSFQTIWKSLPYSRLSGERPDRSRPPQAGAAAHACTASAVRTAPGQNFPPTRTLPSRDPGRRFQQFDRRLSSC